MPILVFFLALMRMMTARWMSRNLRYSLLVIFGCRSDHYTTTDILDMCLFAAPMIALYAISIGVAWLVNSTRELEQVPLACAAPCRCKAPTLSPKVKPIDREASSGCFVRRNISWNSGITVD